VNPAVTLSLLATRKLDVLHALVYMVAQCLGACIGASALYLALPLKATADHFVNKVYWIGPIIGALLAGVSHEFFFARRASRQKLVACLTCKDIEIVETASMTGSSLSTVTQNAMRAKHANKQESN
ncbi:hypothetical protein XENOCAPTIV_009830, partial [Xenoophorus captivus]